MELMKFFNEDSLLFYSFQYYGVPMLEILYVFLLRYMDNPMLLVWLIFALLPMLDVFVPLDLRNPTPEETQKLKQSDLRYKAPVYVAMITDWILEFWTIDYLVQNSTHMSWWTLFIILLVMGSFQGTSVNVSHELIHKEDPFDRMLGIINLSRMFYQHWYIEHLYGHHKRVGTEDDPAQAKRGQRLARFYVQTVIGTITSSWSIEKERLLVHKKLGTIWTLQNKFLYFILCNLALPAIVFKFYGFMGMIYCLIIGSGGILYLELINYIEHYGLKREANEPVTIMHSWNAPHRISNYLLYKLQRHSDHHENAHKPYQILCSYDDSPTLPHGYPVCIMMVLFSKYWMATMEPVVQAAREHRKLNDQEEKFVKKRFEDFIARAFVFLTIISLLTFAV